MGVCRVRPPARTRNAPQKGCTAHAGRRADEQTESNCPPPLKDHNRQPVPWVTRNPDYLGCYPQAHESVLIIDPRNPDKVTVDTTTLTGLGHYQCGKVIRGWIVCPIPQLMYTYAP